MNLNILVTGAAGFIGFHLIKRLLLDGNYVSGIDGMIDSKDLYLKKMRLKILTGYRNFRLIQKMVTKEALKRLDINPDLIIHLAAISGIERFEKNRLTAERITEEALKSVIDFALRSDCFVIYASSSSVYGRLTNKRFSEKDRITEPVSAYALSKLNTEEMFISSGLKSLGVRLFTVYGEFGRPDMSYFRFAEAISKDRPVTIFGRGIKRDFTYIDDVVRSIYLLLNQLDKIIKIGCKIINIGRGRAERIERVVELIGHYLNKKPVIVYEEPRQFDLPYTCADNSLLKSITGYAPDTPLEEGIERFINWFTKARK